MALRAGARPGHWLWRTMTAAALVGVASLVGCGGGGGGGGVVTYGPCGSVTGSTTPVLCGKVLVDGTTTPVSGATVNLRAANGTSLGVSTTTAADGTWKVANAPATAAQFEVRPPALSYYEDMVRFNGSVYSYSVANQAGTSNCYLLTGGVINGDKLLSSAYAFANAAPPPPPFGCAH